MAVEKEELSHSPYMDEIMREMNSINNKISHSREDILFREKRMENQIRMYIVLSTLAASLLMIFGAILLALFDRGNNVVIAMFAGFGSLLIISQFSFVSLKKEYEKLEDKDYQDAKLERYSRIKYFEEMNSK